MDWGGACWPPAGAAGAGAGAGVEEGAAGAGAAGAPLPASDAVLAAGAPPDLQEPVPSELELGVRPRLRPRPPREKLRFEESDIVRHSVFTKQGLKQELAVSKGVA